LILLDFSWEFRSPEKTQSSETANAFQIFYENPLQSTNLYLDEVE